MYTITYLLQMLTSEKASTRYDAFEWFRVKQESSPEIVKEMESAKHDEPKEVAKQAEYALQADVQYQMAIELRKVELDKPDFHLEIPDPIATGE